MSADNGPGKAWIGWLGILIGPALFLLAAFFYWGPELADLPIMSIPGSQRSFLRLAAINVEISSRKWQFDTTTLDDLVDSGTPFAERL